MRFPELHIGRGGLHGGVTVFPVWTADPAVRGVIPARRLDVNEAAAGATVGRVQLGNPLASPSLVADGEVVEGGQQHRALVRSVILAPREWHEVDVVCVEQGRWSGGSGLARRGLRTSTRLRAGLREPAPGVRQDLTWQRVAELGRRVGMSSPTSSFVDLAREVPADNRAVTPLAGQRGVLIGVDGQPLSLDVFGSTALLRAHLPSLLAAARLDASAVEPVPGRRARRMLEHLQDVALDPTGEDAGVGKAVQAETTHAALRAVHLGSGKSAAHLTVLNTRHPVLVIA